jgi:hypothetical protein
MHCKIPTNPTHCSFLIKTSCLQTVCARSGRLTVRRTVPTLKTTISQIIFLKSGRATVRRSAPSAHLPGSQSATTTALAASSRRPPRSGSSRRRAPA